MAAVNLGVSEILMDGRWPGADDLQVRKASTSANRPGARSASSPFATARPRRWCTALVPAVLGATLACSGSGGAMNAVGSGGAGGAAGGPGQGGAGGAIAGTETFVCATAMFSLTSIGQGTVPVYSAYVLTLTPDERRYVGTLRMEALGRETPATPPPAETVALSGVVGRDAIDVTFQGGSVRVTPLAGAADGVLDGSARFDQTLFGFTSPVDSVAVSCWSTAGAPRFHYDLDSGRCIDAAGAEGRQAVTVPMLRETRDGECAILSAGRHVDADPLMPGRVVLNEIALGAHTLVGWNLKGASLAGGSLYFAVLLDADLRGADLSEFMAGYHNITGAIDAHTRGLDGIACIAAISPPPSPDRFVCCTLGGPCE
jgi:hypothetical protein